MAHECKCRGKCGKGAALEMAVDQYHKWDDMVFQGKDGVPPLVNVQLTAYTMDFFLRETELLKLLFASNPKNASSTNTNMATVLYDKDKLVGIAIEYGNDEKAYIAMEQLGREMFQGLPDWQKEPGLHASIMRTRIRQYTGRDIGLIKCADLQGFFGNLGKVVENENTLEMLLEGVKFACNAVGESHLSIQPEPKFFSYLRALGRVTDTIDMKQFAEKLSYAVPNFRLGIVLKGNLRAARIKLASNLGLLYFTDLGMDNTFLSLKEIAGSTKHNSGLDLAVGLSTNFLYNALHAALTHSPYKLGKAVFNAVRNGELVVC